ncbi:MAG: efflux RND transporter periplasmic adaptor subunit [Polyangia bacterium]
MKSFLWLFVIAAACNERGPKPVEKAGPVASRVVELTAQGVANADVRTMKLETIAFRPQLRVIATVSGDPKGIARIGSRVPGRVAKIDVSLGDHVKKGQALIELDAVETHQVTLDLATAKARVRASDDALSRQQQLVAERVGAEQDLRRVEAEAKANRAALHEAEEHLQFLGLSAADVRRAGNDEAHGERSIVRAPIEGQLAALDVSLGQVLQGNEDILTIAQVDKLWIDLRVYERDLGRLESGRAVEVRALAFPDRVFHATLSFIGDVVDPATRTAPARATLNEAPGPLRPGMTATALIALGVEVGSVWLPVSAVQKGENSQEVFVRVGDRRFEPRNVVTGREQGGYVLVKSGLPAGSDVVVSGALSLRGELERAALEE